MVSQLSLIFWVVASFVWLADCDLSCLPNFTDETDSWHHNHETDYNGVTATDKTTPRNIKFNVTLESQINKQINLELFAHYTYLSMAYHFDRDDINLPGFHKFFAKMAKEEHEHAQKFMKYQNKRGGTIFLKSIKKPCNDGVWGNGKAAMKRALELENLIYESLVLLHESSSDIQFQDFLVTHFLAEQVDSIKQLADYVGTLQRLDSALGEYQFDKLTLQND